MWVVICLGLAADFGVTLALGWLLALWWQMGWLKWPRWVVRFLFWWLVGQEGIVVLLIVALFAHILVFR